MLPRRICRAGSLATTRSTQYPVVLVAVVATMTTWATPAVKLPAVMTTATAVIRVTLVAVRPIQAEKEAREAAPVEGCRSRWKG
jgi:hypothetical protein